MVNNELNQQVKKWSQQSASMMRRKVRRLTNSNKHDYLQARKGIALVKSIRYKNLRRYGTVERIVFPFAKHGYFLSVGASRGHKAKTNPRKKVEWFNFVFEDRFEKLADIVGEGFGDEAMVKVRRLQYGYLD